ncbi:MAG: hypothetical protein ABUL58_03170 [Steroidobacter sp.]
MSISLKKIVRHHWVLVLLLPVLLAAGGYAFGANTIKYTYDALGRLTFVNDTINGNRDYDYDKAGNRLFVAVGTATDATAEPGNQPPPPSQPPPPPPPVPAAPTGLFSTQNSNCSWLASWSASQYATSYIFRDASGNHQLTVTTTSVVYGFSSCSISPPTEKPKWVQACNASGCSAKSNFP